VVTFGVVLLFLALGGLLVGLVYVMILTLPLFRGLIRDLWSPRVLALAVATAVALVLAVALLLRLLA
jgi:hypothetical protein